MVGGVKEKIISLLKTNNLALVSSVYGGVKKPRKSKI